MSKIRKSAKGKACTLRLKGCKLDNETTVLAHIRTPGTGRMKPSDSMAVYACHHCHTLQENWRTQSDIMEKELLWRVICGMAETHELLIEDGLMVLK